MPGRSVARPADIDYEIRQLLGDIEPATGGITLDLPRHSDAGTSVPMKLAMGDADLRQSRRTEIHVFASGNPRPRVLAATFSPDAGDAALETRIRLNGAQTVTAIGLVNGGSPRRVDVPVSVSFGACSNVGSGPAIDNSFVPQIRLSVPETARPGDLVPIRTVITHPMEAGFRLDGYNQFIPVRIIERFSLFGDGAELVRIKLEPAVSTNPYLAFSIRAERSLRLGFEWLDTNGAIYEREAALRVE